MTNAQPEPSMEEILASIRRIISEDEEEHPGVDRSGLDTTQQVEQAPEPTLAPLHDAVHDEHDVGPDAADEPRPEMSDQDATLTKMLDMAEAQRTSNATDPVDITPLSPEPETNDTADDHIEIEGAQAAYTQTDDDEAHDEITTEDVKMVKQQANALRDTDDEIVDSTTASAAAAAFGNLSRSVRVSDGEGQTLEAIVTDMMRPLVKEWLDQNLTRIVEDKVEYEVQRLARRG